MRPQGLRRTLSPHTQKKMSATNPFRPTATPDSPCLSDPVVSRLIAGEDTESLVFYDVSDTQIYGAKFRTKLSGELAILAQSSGLLPEAYQSIHWLCFVHMPVWPLATYVVMPFEECDDPDGDADQYRALRVDTDYEQIVWHYSIFFGILMIVTVGVCVWFA